MRKLVIKGSQFAGLDSAAGVSLQKRGHFDFLLEFVGFALVEVAKLFVEGLLAVLEGLLVHLVILLGLFELEGGDADLQDCVSSWVREELPFFLEEGRM